MNYALENYNIATDIRSGGKVEKPVLYFQGCLNCGEPGHGGCCDNYELGELEKELATIFVVCPACRGNGKHVNVAIDAGGLSEEMMDDPDFYADYMGGTYDVTCNRCEGKRVVPEVNWEMLNPTIREAYEAQLEDEAGYEAERLAEIRMGC